MRWWDGRGWTASVSTGARGGIDPLAADPATTELVNRVLGRAMGFVELSESLREAVPEGVVSDGLWADAEGRRDVLEVAHGHLCALEARGSLPARAAALAALSRALAAAPG